MSRSAPKHVKEWLADFKGLSQNELHTYASTIINNEELIHQLHAVLEEIDNQLILEPVCHQLFEFHRSEDEALRRFSLLFIPQLVGVYLSACSKGLKKCCKSMEAYLLGMYNLEVTGKNGEPKVKTFRLPTLAKPSVYHDPPLPQSLTEQQLKRHGQRDVKIIRVGPHPHVQRITAESRLRVLSYLLSVYNAEITDMPKFSQIIVCKICSRLCMTGFDVPSSKGSIGAGGSHIMLDRPCSESSVFSMEPQQARVRLSSTMMLEMLQAVYYVIFREDVLYEKAIPGIFTVPPPVTFNYLGAMAVQSLEDIHARAIFELMPDVVLVTNAIRNSLEANPSGSPSATSPMGVSVTATPSTSDTALNKRLITNASFRIKKLPEDIAIVNDGKESTSAAAAAAAAPNNLSAITEEAGAAAEVPMSPVSKVTPSSVGSEAKEKKSGIKMGGKFSKNMLRMSDRSARREKSKSVSGMTTTTPEKKLDMESSAENGTPVGKSNFSNNNLTGDKTASGQTAVSVPVTPTLDMQQQEGVELADMSSHQRRGSHKFVRSSSETDGQQIKASSSTSITKSTSITVALHDPSDPGGGANAPTPKPSQVVSQV